MEKPVEETNGQRHRFVDVSANQEHCAYIYLHTLKRLAGSQENCLASQVAKDSMARAISAAKHCTEVRSASQVEHMQCHLVRMCTYA